MDTAAVEEDTVVGMVYEEVAGMEDKVLVHILLLYNLVQKSSFIIEYVEKKKSLAEKAANVGMVSVALHKQERANMHDVRISIFIFRS